MPLFTYQCDCGVRFESPGSMKEATQPCKCPSCGEDAQRHLPDGVSGVFQQNVTGPVPQNTGITQLDAHIDRVIGKSAEQSWVVHEERKSRKKDLLEQDPGATQAHISRNPDGTYRTLTDKEAGVHHRANLINAMAMKARKVALEGPN
jgi:putative FmdB family regulatory protein